MTNSPPVPDTTSGAYEANSFPESDADALENEVAIEGAR